MSERHRIEFFIGPNTNGLESRLVCPETCDDREMHKHEYEDEGIELISYTPVEEVLSRIDVVPVIRRYNNGDPILMLNPIVIDMRVE